MEKNVLHQCGQSTGIPITCMARREVLEGHDKPGQLIVPIVSDTQPKRPIMKFVHPARRATDVDVRSRLRKWGPAESEVVDRIVKRVAN